MIKLLQGDCLERMKEIPDGSVDMILTDPPYGTTACKWDSVIPLEPMWEQLKRIIKPNGAIVMTASQPFTTTLIASNMKQFKYCWIWDKVLGTGFANANKMPLRASEDVVVFYRKLPDYNPQKTLRDKNKKRPPRSDLKGDVNVITGMRSTDKGTMTSDYKHPTNIIQINKQSNELNSRHQVHPTQKPVALMEYLIKTYTNENETVLDFTMGSGSTGVAAKNLNRDFIGIELDLDYFNIALDRINPAKVEQE
jgi:site-specific DNA-methyltransferase (adenine-specific)